MPSPSYFRGLATCTRENKSSNKIIIACGNASYLSLPIVYHHQTGSYFFFKLNPSAQPPELLTFRILHLPLSLPPSLLSIIARHFLFFFSFFLFFLLLFVISVFPSLFPQIEEEKFSEEEGGMEDR